MDLRTFSSLFAPLLTSLLAWTANAPIEQKQHIFVIYRLLNKCEKWGKYFTKWMKKFVCTLWSTMANKKQQQMYPISCIHVWTNNCILFSHRKSTESETIISVKYSAVTMIYSIFVLCIFLFVSRRSLIVVEIMNTWSHEIVCLISIIIARLNSLISFNYRDYICRFHSTVFSFGIFSKKMNEKLLAKLENFRILSRARNDYQRWLYRFFSVFVVASLFTCREYISSHVCSATPNALAFLRLSCAVCSGTSSKRYGSRQRIIFTDQA